MPDNSDSRRGRGTGETPRWNEQRQQFEIQVRLSNGTRRTLRNRDKDRLEEQRDTLLATDQAPMRVVIGGQDITDVDTLADALAEALARNSRFVRAQIYIMTEVLAKQAQLPKEPATKGGYNTREAARYLGLSVSSIERLISQGTIPSFKIGGKRLIATSALDAYVERMGKSKDAGGPTSIR